MIFVKKSKYLIAPPYSEKTETFLSPIPCPNSEVTGGLKLAGGWRCFKNLKVLQKKKR